MLMSVSHLLYKHVRLENDLLYVHNRDQPCQALCSPSRLRGYELLNYISSTLLSAPYIFILHTVFLLATKALTLPPTVLYYA